MKPTKPTNNRWEKQKPMGESHSKSSDRFYCDRCKDSFPGYSEFDNHPCGVLDVSSSE